MESQIWLEGKDVCAVFAGKETSMSEECRQQRQIASNLGVSVVTNIPPKEYTVVIDAVFGVGLSRTIEGHYKDVIEEMNQIHAEKVAIDIPSGISSFDGQVLGTAFHADLTVSFACEKLGTVLFAGSDYAGEVIPVEIGIGTKLFEENPEVCYTLEKSDLSKFLPDRKKNSHKGSYGKILMITGSKGMSGAAYLSARAAYISGGGLVQIYTEESNRTILQQLLPEAIVSTYTEYEEEKLQSLLKWADVICIGCGLGKSRTAGQILSYLMKYAEVPCVRCRRFESFGGSYGTSSKRKKAICTDTTYERNGRTFGVYHPGTWEKQICCVKRIYRQLWCCLCTEGCTYACGRKRPADVSEYCWKQCDGKGRFRRCACRSDHRASGAAYESV